MTTTTVAEVMATMYTVLCTEPYHPRSRWTITDYAVDPLYVQPVPKFELDPVINAQVLQRGPAAKVYTPKELKPK